jgi:serine/threonine-protein kinase
VAGFVRQVFSDRIQKRDAHLAWAAEVTSTINVDSIRAGQTGLPGTPDDLSIVSYGEQVKRNRAVVTPQPQLPPVMPQSGAFPAMRPEDNGPAGAPVLGGPLPAPPAKASQPGAGNIQPGAPMAGPDPQQPMAPMQQMSASSLMDDDEDVPTTVANRDQGESGGVRPAAGMPALPAAGAPAYATQPHAGGYPGDPNAAVDDLGATIALPSTVNRVQQQIAEAERARQMQGNVNPYAPTYHHFGGPAPYNGYPQQQQQQQPFPGAAYDPYGAQTAVFPPPQPMATYGHPFPPGIQPQSQIETALSLPRPDPAALWIAQQNAAQQAPQRRNTGVLVGVVVLTALCVIGIAALVYLKFLRPPTETVATSDSAPPTAIATATPAPPPTPAPVETPTPVATPAPTPTPTATAVAAPSPPTAAVATQAPRPAPVATSSPAPAATHESSTDSPKAGSTNEEPGFITIVCNPFCDDVQIDGRTAGPSPIIRQPAKPGQHRITCKRAGAATKVISIMVVAGQVSPAKVRME